jgi:hypothetical protein
MTALDSDEHGHLTLVVDSLPEILDELLSSDD